MATAATASLMERDTRNLEWKSNNVGSKLLAKMGWKEGQGIGKRRKLDAGAEESTTTEGLRVKRRTEGLGLGAVPAALQNSNHHIADFSSLLQDLNQQHGTGSNSRSPKSKKKKKNTTTCASSSSSAVVGFATNKFTNAKVRRAKFQERTAEDLKSIFAGAVDHAFVTATTTTTPEKGKTTPDQSAGKSKKDTTQTKKKKSKKRKADISE